MAKKFGFSKAERLTKDKEFRRVFKKGKSFANNNLVIYVYQRDFSEGKQARLGLVLSRKLGKAVKRNKLKRRLREIFRLHKYLLKPELDIIFLPQPKAILSDYQDLEKSILNLFRKGKLFTDTNIHE